MSTDKASTQSSGAPSPKGLENPAEMLGRNAIGSVNLDYYLPIWSRYEASNSVGTTWNWSAALYTLNWMVFRGLWKPAQLYLGTLLCAVAVSAIIHRVLPMSETAQVGTTILLVFASIVIPGMFGNAWFIADIQKKIIMSVEASSTMAEANLHLKQQASTRQGFIRLLQINGGLAMVAGFSCWFVFSTNPPPSSDAPKAQSVGSLDVAPIAGAPTAVLAVPVARPPTPNTSDEVTLPQTPPPQVAELQILASAPMTAPTPALNHCNDCPGKDNSFDSKGGPSKKPTTLSQHGTNPRTAPARKTEKENLAPKLPSPTLEKPAVTRANSEKQQYFVNVGLFAKQANGEAAHAMLEDAGLLAAKQELATPNGKRIRVRAGPFESLSQAEEAAVKIRLLNLDAKIVPLR